MVLLIGAYPPPYGGNSIHIQRLHRLCKVKGMDCVVLNPYRGFSNLNEEDVIEFRGNAVFRILNLISSLRKFSRNEYRIVHIHVTALEKFRYVGIPILLACRGFKKVLTIHGGDFIEVYEKGNFLRRRLIQYLVSRFDKIITVNNEQKEFLITEFGIAAQRVVIIPAFLPPLLNRNFTFSESANLIFEVTKLRSKFDKLGLVAGYILPLYGFHDVLDALNSVRKLGVKLGLIFVFYTESDKKYESQLMERINKISGVLILRDIKPEAFIEILKYCDVFIRPTYLDGDSIALREAIYLGKQVIASDCVKRPDGCVLFKLGDTDDLARKLVDVARDENLGIVSDVMVENGERILKVYKELSGEP